MLSTYVTRLQSYFTKPVTLYDAIDYDMHEIVRRIVLYKNDRFLEAKEEGAIFWNMSTPRIPHFAKNIDFDTKDLQPYGMGEANMTQVWILKQKFHLWITNTELALTLNNLAWNLSTFGSWVWKLRKVDGEWTIEEPNLCNLFFDPCVKSLRGQDKAEIHYMSKYDIMLKRGIWDNVEDLLKKLENLKDNEDAEIWEYWGRDYEDESNKRFVHAYGWGYGDDEIVLFEEDESEEDDPYYDFHVGEYDGRWLRKGVVERLFPIQVRANALVNQNAATTEIASLVLLRSSNPEMTGNVFSNAETGDIVTSSDLQQIAIDNRAISTFISEMSLLEQQADKLCLTPQVVTGEMTPSGTPFRTVATISNAAKSTFGFIRQSIGETISKIMIDRILPSVVKGWQSGEIMEIAQDQEDILMYDKSLKAVMKRQMFVDNLLKGVIVPEEQLEATVAPMVEEALQRGGRKVEIPKNYFDFEYGIRLNVTGESQDKQQQNDAMFNALQMASANPALVNTPMFRQYLENNGLEYWKLTPEEVQTLKPQQGQAPTGGQPIQAKTDALLSQVNS